MSEMGYSDIPTDLGYGDVQPEGTTFEGLTGEDIGDARLERAYARDLVSRMEAGEDVHQEIALAIAREQGPAEVDESDRDTAVAPGDGKIAGGEPHAETAEAPSAPADPMASTDPTAPSAAQYETVADQQEHQSEAEELQTLQQDLQQAAETTQLLSNIDSTRHQMMMGIIGNIR